MYTLAQARVAVVEKRSDSRPPLSSCASRRAHRSSLSPFPHSRLARLLLLPQTARHVFRPGATHRQHVDRVHPGHGRREADRHPPVDQGPALHDPAGQVPRAGQLEALPPVRAHQQGSRQRSVSLPRSLLAGLGHDGWVSPLPRLCAAARCESGRSEQLLAAHCVSSSSRPRADLERVPLSVERGASALKELAALPPRTGTR